MQKRRPSINRTTSSHRVYSAVSFYLWKDFGEKWYSGKNLMQKLFRVIQLAVQNSFLLKKSIFSNVGKVINVLITSAWFVSLWIIDVHSDNRENWLPVVFYISNERNGKIFLNFFFHCSFFWYFSVLFSSSLVLLFSYFWPLTSSSFEAQVVCLHLT